MSRFISATFQFENLQLLLLCLEGKPSSSTPINIYHLSVHFNTLRHRTEKTVLVQQYIRRKKQRLALDPDQAQVHNS